MVCALRAFIHSQTWVHWVWHSACKRHCFQTSFSCIEGKNIMSRFLSIWSNPLSLNATVTQFSLLSYTMKVACDFSVFKAVNEKIEITFRSGGFIIRKLCKGGFKHSTSTGTIAFSFFICLDASNVVLFSVFTLIETICLKIEAKVSKSAKRLLSVDLLRSETLLLKLPG